MNFGSSVSKHLVTSLSIVTMHVYVRLEYKNVSILRITTSMHALLGLEPNWSSPSDPNFSAFQTICFPHKYFVMRLKSASYKCIMRNLDSFGDPLSFLIAQETHFDHLYGNAPDLIVMLSIWRILIVSSPFAVSFITCCWRDMVILMETLSFYHHEVVCTIFFQRQAYKYKLIKEETDHGWHHSITPNILLIARSSTVSRNESMYL